MTEYDKPNFSAGLVLVGVCTMAAGSLELHRAGAREDSKTLCSDTFITVSWPDLYIEMSKFSAALSLIHC